MATMIVNADKLSDELSVYMNVESKIFLNMQPSADPEGGTGGPDLPWKITSHMGFYRE